jgi:hypothetical protein
VSVVSAATRKACSALAEHLRVRYRGDFVVGVGSRAEKVGDDVVDHPTLVVYHQWGLSPDIGAEWMGLTVILCPDGAPIKLL